MCVSDMRLTSRQVVASTGDLFIPELIVDADCFIMARFIFIEMLSCNASIELIHCVK